MLDNGIQIVRQFEQSRIDAGGAPVAFVVVTFKVGDAGPFTEAFPKLGFTAQQVDDRLNAFAHQIRRT